MGTRALRGGGRVFQFTIDIRATLHPGVGRVRRKKVARDFSNVLKGQDGERLRNFREGRTSWRVIEVKDETTR